MPSTSTIRGWNKCKHPLIVDVRAEQYMHYNLVEKSRLGGHLDFVTREPK